MKTHLVIDLVYHSEEENEIFAGTLKECNEWMNDQDTFGLVVMPMTEEQIKIHNSDVSIASNGHRYHNIPKELDVETWDKMNVAERLRYKGLL